MFLASSNIQYISLPSLLQCANLIKWPDPPSHDVSYFETLQKWKFDLHSRLRRQLPNSRTALPPELDRLQIDIEARCVWLVISLPRRGKIPVYIFRNDICIFLLLPPSLPGDLIIVCNSKMYATLFFSLVHSFQRGSLYWFTITDYHNRGWVQTWSMASFSQEISCEAEREKGKTLLHGPAFHAFLKYQCTSYLSLSAIQFEATEILTLTFRGRPLLASVLGPRQRLHLYNKWEIERETISLDR